MDVIDTIRRVLAVLLLVTGPPAVLYWFTIHPFAPRWRRLGAKPTFWIVGTAMVAIAVGLFFMRDPLLGRDLGGSLPLFLVGVVFYVAAAWLTLRTRRVLPFAVFAGVPEVSADGRGHVITEGVYAHIRHPRYASVILGMVGFAMMVNFVGTYVLTAAMFGALIVLIPLEDRELVHRFGEEYERYRERVPPLIPRVHS